MPLMKPIWIGLAVLSLAASMAASGYGAELGSSCKSEEVVSIPSRPNLANSTDITQCGVVEFEYGWTRRWPGRGANGDAFGSAFRVGVSQNLEIRLGTDEVLRTSEAGHSDAGLGDNSLAFKYRFVAEREAKPSLAAFYAVKLPTASAEEELGSGYADHTFALLASKNVGANHFDFNVVATLIGGPGAFGHAGLLVLDYSRPVSKRLVAITEFSGYVHPVGAAVGTVAINYKVCPRLTFDTGLDFGISEGAPRKRLMVGVTYAVGKIFGRRPDIRAHERLPAPVAGS